MDKSKTSIMEILRKGNIIRMVDGRYTDGFVDVEDLQDLITDGLAEPFVDKGFGFVRLAKRQDSTKESETMTPIDVNTDAGRAQLRAPAEAADELALQLIQLTNYPTDGQTYRRFVQTIEKFIYARSPEAVRQAAGWNDAIEAVAAFLETHATAYNSSGGWMVIETRDTDKQQETLAKAVRALKRKE